MWRDELRATRKQGGQSQIEQDLTVALSVSLRVLGLPSCAFRLNWLPSSAAASFNGSTRTLKVSGLSFATSSLPSLRNTLAHEITHAVEFFRYGFQRENSKTRAQIKPRLIPTSDTPSMAELDQSIADNKGNDALNYLNNPSEVMAFARMIAERTIRSLEVSTDAELADLATPQGAWRAVQNDTGFQKIWPNLVPESKQRFIKMILAEVDSRCRKELERRRQMAAHQAIQPQTATLVPAPSKPVSPQVEEPKELKELNQSEPTRSWPSV